MNEPKKGTPLPRSRRHWYAQLFERRLRLPGPHNTRKVAEEMGVSYQWLLRVLRSDAYRRYEEERLREMREDVEKRLLSLLDQSLSSLEERVKSPATPTEEVRKSAEMVLQTLGFSKNAPPPQVQVNIAMLEEARRRLSEKVIEAGRKPDDDA